MKLRVLLVADHASTDPSSGKLYVTGGGITRIAAPLPTTLPFLTFLAQFLLEDADYGNTHSAQIRITGPDGEQVGDIPPAGMGPFERAGEPGEEQTYTVGVTIGGIPVVSAGPYDFEIAVDGESVGVVRVLITEAPDDPALAP